MDLAKVEAYLETLVPPRPAELQRMEEKARASDFPIIEPLCGQLCYLMARTMGAQRIFELGSGYGYSTAWFAQAVRENGGGEVWHVVWDEGLSQQAREHLAALGHDDLIRYRVGEAAATLKETPGPFDLIFLDIDKTGYPGALPLIREKLRPGGLLLADNMLWRGHIADPDNHEAQNEAIRTLAETIAADPAWTMTIVPLRDGLMVARLNQ